MLAGRRQGEDQVVCPRQADGCAAETEKEIRVRAEVPQQLSEG
jgi:hypothetical protein